MKFKKPQPPESTALFETRVFVRLTAAAPLYTIARAVSQAVRGLPGYVGHTQPLLIEVTRHDVEQSQ